MKRSFLLMAVLLACVSAPAAAQAVTGRVWVGNSGAARAAVTVTCGQRAYDATADANGVYSLTAAVGDCAVQVTYQGKPSNRIAIRITQGPNTANLELTDQGNIWALTRRG